MSLSGHESAECQPVKAYDRAFDWYLGFQRYLLEHASDYGAFAKMLGGSETLSMNVDRVLEVHDKVMRFLHWSLNSQLRNLFSGAVARYAEDRYGPLTYDRSSDTLRETLDRQGFVQLPSIDRASVTALLDWFDAAGLIPPERIKDNPVTCDPKSPDILRQNGNIGQVPRERLLRAPGLASLALDPFALGLAEQHLGAPPILIDMSAWRSFAGEDGAKEAKSAQHFHYDQDDYRFCKMFIYLTDVDDGGGPHVYVPATHLSETIVARRPPEGSPDREAFDSWYYRTLRKSQRDVGRWLGIDPVSITGQAGSRFIVNTEGIHRGDPPATHDRWVLQCVYGITPYTFWKGEYAAPRVPALDPAAAYAAQLLFST